MLFKNNVIDRIWSFIGVGYQTKRHFLLHSKDIKHENVLVQHMATSFHCGETGIQPVLVSVTLRITDCRQISANAWVCYWSSTHSYKSTKYQEKQLIKNQQYYNNDDAVQTRYSKLVSWSFKPSQPQRVIYIYQGWGRLSY